MNDVISEKYESLSDEAKRIVMLQSQLLWLMNEYLKNNPSIQTELEEYNQICFEVSQNN